MLKDICVVGSLGLWWTKLQWIWMYRFSCEHKLFFCWKCSLSLEFLASAAVPYVDSSETVNCFSEGWYHFFSLTCYICATVSQLFSLFTYGGWWVCYFPVVLLLQLRWMLLFISGILRRMVTSLHSSGMTMILSTNPLWWTVGSCIFCLFGNFGFSFLLLNLDSSLHILVTSPFSHLSFQIHHLSLKFSFSQNLWKHKCTILWSKTYLYLLYA